MTKLQSVTFFMISLALSVFALPIFSYADLEVSKDVVCDLDDGECDEGICDTGLCIGGANNGEACTINSDCGECTAGASVGAACDEDSDCGDTAVDLDAIPVFTEIFCTFSIEVCAVNGQTVNDIVVTDGIGAEFENCAEEPDDLNLVVGAKKGIKNRGSTPIMWDAGDLDGSVADACSTSTDVVCDTRINPSTKHQSYTSCGDVSLNQGPTATGIDAGTSLPVLASGDPVEGTVVNPDDPDDADMDCVDDAVDNCPANFNPDQADADGDGLGDVCDSCPNDPNNDADGDGVCGDVDNCPATANADQADADVDGEGDACDATPLGVCGDGLVLGTETCDDGNTTDGDGCSSTCQTEGP